MNKLKRSESNETLVEMIKNPADWEGKTINEVRDLLALKFNCSPPAATTITGLYDAAGLKLGKYKPKMNRPDNRERAMALAIVRVQEYLETELGAPKFNNEAIKVIGAID